MPNFKEFIKGFEEKPEAKNPNPAPTPKPQEVKMEEPKSKEELDLDKRFEAEDKAIQKYRAMGYSKPEAQQKANIEVNYGGDFDKNYEYGEDKEWRKPQPKEGSFEKAFGDMSKPEQGLGDFNPSERIEDYQSGAKTHSENEFRLEALNDRGMYDFISKNRDYLYRKANSDPEGAIKDILLRGQGNYDIKPENIRKDYVMEVLKSFYEDDEGAIPDFTKQEEFKPSEEIEKFDDYYGAKTVSERDLNLLTGNDRGAYEYVYQNRDALAKEAEYDPAMVLNKIRWHASNPSWVRELKGDSIRKDYLINVIKGIVED